MLRAWELPELAGNGGGTTDPRWSEHYTRRHAASTTAFRSSGVGAREPEELAALEPTRRNMARAAWRPEQLAALEHGRRRITVAVGRIQFGN